VTTLANAPLVEVATQIRWGATEKSAASGPLKFKFSEAEEKELPSVFERFFGEAGFGHVEPFAPELEDVQFSLSRRYRSGPSEWPVYQTGLGVFAIHQRNEGYDWPLYKESVLQGLRVLVKALDTLYDTVPFIGIDLMYLDHFPLNEGEHPGRFLRENFKVRVDPPKEFLGSELFSDQTPSSASLSFGLETKQPDGMLMLSLEYAKHITGSAGYLMDTHVRSLVPSVAFTQSEVDGWLDAAHEVQRHAFRTLIKPAYLKSFQ
jgi:uncharacterized protein (TIGR04255 family)